MSRVVTKIIVTMAAMSVYFIDSKTMHIRVSSLPYFSSNQNYLCGAILSKRWRSHLVFRGCVSLSSHSFTSVSSSRVSSGISTSRQR